MNDLEDVLHSALHQVGDQSDGRALCGPALRRKARVRSLRVRTGGVAALSAAAVTGVVVAPSLVSRPASRSGQGVGASVTTSATSAAHAQKLAAAKGAAGDPAGKAQPSTSFTGKPAPSAPAGPSATKAPADGTWDPSGALIADSTVLSVAPKVAATDQDWKNRGGQLLDQSTVKVVFADREPIDSSWRTYLRPLVIVTGRTSTDGPLQVASMTTISGGVDSERLQNLVLDGMTAAATSGPASIAVDNGMAVYVAAEAGVDSATYSYHDSTGEHTASMKVQGGVATALLDDVKAGPSSGTGTPSPEGSQPRTVTHVTALSHGKVVWDAAPVKSH